MLQIQPKEVRSAGAGLAAAVLFEVPGRPDLAIQIPHDSVGLVRRAFERRLAGPSLFDIWCMSSFADGQYAEVIIETKDGRARASVVMVNGGPVWRTPLDPVDAVLTGFHYSLPFFMADAEAREELPTRIKLPLLVRAAAAVRGNRPPTVRADVPALQQQSRPAHQA